MNVWRLQEAKARLSEVIKRATEEGPQDITVRGEPTVVVLSKKDYERLKRSKGSLVDFMRSSPLCGLQLDFERTQTLTRKADLQ